MPNVRGMSRRRGSFGYSCRWNSCSGFIRGEDFGAAEDVLQRGTGFLQGGSYKRRAGNQNQIQTGGERIQVGTHRLPQKPLGSIPLHSPTSRLPCRDTHFHVRASVAGLHHQHNKRVGIRLTSSPHPLEIFRSGQSKLALHPYLDMDSLPAKTAGIDLPTDFLDVLVGSDRQLMTTTQATALEDVSPVGGGHAASKTVYADTAANLRLVCSFGHSKTLPLYKIIASPSGGAGCQIVARNYTSRVLIRSI